MKSVLIDLDREELISRIEKLHENSQPGWGKMNISQMLKHCVLCEQLYLGDVQVKRSFLGRIFGEQAIKTILKDDSPLKRNAPTNRVFRITESTADVEAEKAKWIDLIQKYEHYTKPVFIHWFFGE